MESTSAEPGSGLRPKRCKTLPGDVRDDEEAATSPSCAMTKKQKTASSQQRFCWSPVPQTPVSASGDEACHAAYHGDSPDSCPSADEEEEEEEREGEQRRQLETREEEDPCPTLLPKPADLHAWLAMFQTWTNAERMAALESLVTNGNCDGQQIRFLLSLIEPQLQRDFVSLLPKELALYVLSFLDPKDLLQAAQTCRYWRILCEDNLLWREKCREEGLLEDQETVVDLFRKRSAKNRSKSLTLHSRCAPATPSPGSSGTSESPQVLSSEYKLGFLRQKSIEYNWRYGRFPTDPEAGGSSPPASGGKGRYLRSIQQLKGHDDHVITCLQFNPTSK